MKKLLVILIISLISQLSQANERFIPLELFTGGEIREDTEIKFTFFPSVVFFCDLMFFGRFRLLYLLKELHFRT